VEATVIPATPTGAHPSRSPCLPGPMSCQALASAPSGWASAETGRTFGIRWQVPREGDPHCQLQPVVALMGRELQTSLENVATRVWGISW
jgi:hypothetical protein